MYGVAVETLKRLLYFVLLRQFKQLTTAQAADNSYCSDETTWSLLCLFQVMGH